MNVLRNKKKVTGMVGLVIIVMLLSVFLIPTSLMAVGPQEDVGAMGTPDPVPGEIFAGDYLRVGINHGGTLGVGHDDPGVGFQWAGLDPPNPTESLAIWWWGEGYKIAYKVRDGIAWEDKVAYYQPGYGYPPPDSTNIIPVSHKEIRNDNNAAVKEVKVMTRDRKLLLTFTFTLLKEYPELNLETTIKNRRSELIRDIVYTRIVDWDVCQNTGGNMWASTDHAAYAWYNDPDDEPDLGNVQLTVAGHDGMADHSGKLSMMSWMLEKCAPMRMPLVSYVDLNAWDDQEVREPNSVTQSFVPIQGDYNAGIYYKIGDLMYGSKATVYTVYQANFPRD